MSRGSRDLKKIISNTRDNRRHSHPAKQVRVSASSTIHTEANNGSNWAITNSVFLYNNSVQSHHSNYSSLNSIVPTPYSNSNSAAPSPIPQFSQIDKDNSHPIPANKSIGLTRASGIDGANQTKVPSNMKVSNNRTQPKPNALSVSTSQTNVDNTTSMHASKHTQSLSPTSPEDTSNVNDSSDLVHALKSKLEEQKKELEMRYESIASIQRNFENLSQLYQKEVSKSNELNSLLEQSERKVTELQLKMNDIELNDNQLQLLRMQYNELLDKKEKTEEIVNMKLTEIAKVNQRVIRLNEQNLKLQNQIDELENELKRTQLEAKSKELISHDSQSSIAEIHLALNNERSSSKEKEFEIRRLTSSIKEVRRKLKDLEENNEKEKNTFLELKEKKRELEQEKLQLLEQYQSFKLLAEQQEKSIKILEASLHRKVKDCSELEAQLSQLHSEKIQIQEETTKRESTISSLRSLLTQYEKDIQSLQQENESRNQTINLLKVSVTELQSTLIAQKQLYAVLESKLKEEQGEVKTLQDKIAWHVKNMDQEYGQQLQMEQKYQAEISKLSSEKDSLSHECSSLSELNERLQAELRSLIDNNYESKIEELVNQRALLEDKIDKMNEVIQELKSKNTSFKHQYDTVSKDRNALKQELEDMEREMKKLEEQKRATEQWRREAESLKQQLDNKSLEMETLSGENTNLKCTIETQAQEMNRLGELEKKLSLLEKREIHLMATIDKLMKTEEVTESSLTCMSCMNLMNNPCICVPCGHVYCESCWQEHSRKNDSPTLECMECETRVTDVVRHCEVLDQLVQKHKFRKQTLENIAKISREYVSTSISN